MGFQVYFCVVRQVATLCFLRGSDQPAKRSDMSFRSVDSLFFSLAFSPSPLSLSSILCLAFPFPSFLFGIFHSLAHSPLSLSSPSSLLLSFPPLSIFFLSLFLSSPSILNSPFCQHPPRSSSASSLSLSSLFYLSFPSLIVIFALSFSHPLTIVFILSFFSSTFFSFSVYLFSVSSFPSLLYHLLPSSTFLSVTFLLVLTSQYIHDSVSLLLFVRPQHYLIPSTSSCNKYTLSPCLSRRNKAVEDIVSLNTLAYFPARPEPPAGPLGQSCSIHVLLPALVHPSGTLLYTPRTVLLLL